MSILNYLLIAGLIILVDLPWLVLGSKQSKAMVESIQHSPLTVRYLPAIIVYLALSYLVTLPENNNDAFMLGFCIYAVYDFTNLSTFKNYSVKFAVADSLWGGVLFVIVYNIIVSLKLKK
uniref:DUF2177 family protein n=1 Tax=viral metagenome TaxID=1070528 RepID=A0A6C0D6B0_9ZZZZ